MAGFPPEGSGEWRARLWGCLADPSTCCRVCFCPFCAFGEIAHVLERGDKKKLSLCTCCCLVTICCACYCQTCGFRHRLRVKYGLPAKPCNDYCVDCFCLPCSLVQQYRELKYHDIDPRLEWRHNKQTYEQPIPTRTAPPVQQEKMSRQEP